MRNLSEKILRVIVALLLTGTLFVLGQRLWRLTFNGGSAEPTDITVAWLVFVAALVTVLAVVFWLSSRTRQARLADLERATEKIAAGDLVVTPPLADDDFDGLASALNRLADRLSQERRMMETERVSLRQKINVKLDQDRETAEAKAAIINILEDTNAAWEAAQRERDKLNFILKSIGDAVVATDTGGRITFMNRTATHLTGNGFEQSVGHELEEIVNLVSEPEMTPDYEFFDRAIAERRVITITGHGLLVTKNGAVIPITATASPVSDGHGGILGGIIVLRDVSQEREADRIKSEFISIASHQLRTPLTSMRWMFEMISGGDLGEVSPKQKEYIENIHEVLVRMDEVVSTLLKVSRLDAKRTVIRLDEVALEPLLTELINEQEPATQRKHQSLSKDIPQGFPELNTDRAILQEIIANLLSNAVKYTPENGTIKLSAVQEGGHVLVSVTDDGMGIPLDQQAQIFGKFFRAENARRNRTDGNGLGLYIVKQFTEMLGGEISFTSQEGRGTTFNVRLPIKPPPSVVKLATPPEGTKKL
jgi:PAS domain S-box-containing protein